VAGFSTEVKVMFKPPAPFQYQEYYLFLREPSSPLQRSVAAPLKKPTPVFFPMLRAMMVFPNGGGSGQAGMAGGGAHGHGN
jgi:hypothetical protein